MKTYSIHGAYKASMKQVDRDVASMSESELRTRVRELQTTIFIYDYIISQFTWGGERVRICNLFPKLWNSLKHGSPMPGIFRY